MKRNSGVKLTDKEVIELQRLIRTLASRKYRQRQSSKKHGGLIKTASGTGPVNEDCTVEDLNARIEHLEKTLSQVQDREKLFVEREKQALQRERQYQRREKAYLNMIKHLRKTNRQTLAVNRKRVAKAEDKAQETIEKLTNANGTFVSEGVQDK